MTTAIATRTAADRLFSDAHKDAYGFRPSSGQWAIWAQMTDAELDVEEDRLYAEVEASIDRENAEQEIAARHFDAHLKNLIALGAGDIKTALRWDRDAVGISDEEYAFYGNSYHEYHHGLAFGHISKLLEV